MTRKIVAMGAAAAAAAALASCGGDGTTVSTETTPPTSAPQLLDTAQVLSQAQQTSETAQPYVVDNGQLTLTDTSETAAPINVNKGT